MDKLIPVAIVYDFDGTLVQGNMRGYTLIPERTVTPKQIWVKAERLAKERNADSVLTYMYLLLKEAKDAGTAMKKVDFRRYGESFKLSRGIKFWFDRIDQYGKNHGLGVEHYIVSSTIQEMIAGTLIASKFTRIYASSYLYDANDVAEWPRLAVNFTTKTQYLTRISKGALETYDEQKVNEFMRMEDRPIPFRHIIYIGDGKTDIPCFSFVRSLGGYSIAVYEAGNRQGRILVKELVEGGRVDFIAPLNYSEKGRIDTIVKSILDGIRKDIELYLLRPKPNQTRIS